MSKRGPMPEWSKFLIAFISVNYTSINLKHIITQFHCGIIRTGRLYVLVVLP